MTEITRASQFELPSLVRQAAAALARAVTAAEVLAAGELAASVYDAAKRTARLQKVKRAHDDVLAATHRAQADALEIESLAKRRLADEYDAARPAGAEKGGRPKTVPDENGFTAEEAGLSRKQIYDARQVRDAIAENPGIVRRALDELMASGDEPTRAALKRELGLSRANLRAAVGTDSATAAERGNNLYQTGPEAMATLLALESFLTRIYEPAVGKGAIMRMLEAAGFEVSISDLVDYGTVTKHGECQGVIDFLATKAGDDDYDIVTNPPYGAVLNAFVAHALRVHRPRKLALLLNLNFLAGFEDPDRCFAMDLCPPSRVIVFSRRLPMMHRDGWDGEEAGSRMNCAWFIWERNEAGSYAGPTIVTRANWTDFENAPALPPADRGAPREDKPQQSGECPGPVDAGAQATAVSPSKRGKRKAVSA